MEIKLELLKNEISELVTSRLENINIDADKIADTTAIAVLEEIKEIIKSDLSDFEMIEEIISIFKKHNISCGGCHDF